MSKHNRAFILTRVFKLCAQSNFPKLVGMLFVLFYISDRKTNKNVKYPNRLTTNYIWRFLILMMYVPIWIDFIQTYIGYYGNWIEENLFTLIYIVRGLFPFLFFEYKDIMTVIREAITQNTLTHMGFYMIYFYIPRIFTAFVPTNIIRLPMYARYHIAMIFIYSYIGDWFFRTYAGFINLFWPVPTSLGTIGMNPRALFLLIFIFLVTIGHSTLDALQGKFFTGNFLAKTARLHLGFGSLYEDENWSMYDFKDGKRRKIEIIEYDEDDDEDGDEDKKNER